MSFRSLRRRGAASSRVRALASFVPLVPLVPLVMAAPGPARAQAAPAETVFITATRTPQPLSSVLADVSVVDREAIERSGAFSVADVLARLPGIEIARNGGVGTTTSVFIRGSESRHTAVYVDGVRLDSQSTGGAVWEQIPLDQIDRIEVLRGPAAAVYGSDAVGGVVQLFTRRGRGAATPSAALVLGSRGTVQAQAGVSGAAGAWDYAASVTDGRGDGFSARTTPTANPDADGWRRSAAQARVGWQASDVHRFDASLVASNLRAQYDGSATADDVSRHQLRVASLAWQGRWSDSATTRLQLGQSDSTYETRPSPYRTETTLRNLTLQHEQRTAAGTLSATLERRDDELRNPAAGSTAALHDRRHQNGIGLGWRGDFGAHGFQANLRHDDDSEFGGQHTGQLGWGWAFAPGWRATASASTSFRAPTLYQRFSRYGNPELTPERGRNAELGLRWAAAGREASLTVWRNRVRHLIAFGDPGPCADSFGCYANVGRATLEGATLAGRGTWGGVTLHGSLDWHDPRNTDTDKLLQRRARRLASFGAETSWAGWTAGVELQAAGERFDDAANTRRLGGYGLVNLFASRTLRPGLVLEARIDNAGDKAYELARTYVTAGRSAQLALRWTAL